MFLYTAVSKTKKAKPMFNRSTKKIMHFSDFLTEDYARDYINQDMPYFEQIERAASLIVDTDCAGRSDRNARAFYL